MIKTLFIAAIACVLIGFAYTNAYTSRKKELGTMDTKCNNYYIYATALMFFAKTLCLIVLGMLVFKLA